MHIQYSPRRKKMKDVLDYALLSQICKSTHCRMYVLPDSNFDSIFRHSTWFVIWNEIDLNHTWDFGHIWFLIIRGNKKRNEIIEIFLQDFFYPLLVIMLQNFILRAWRFRFDEFTVMGNGQGHSYLRVNIRDAI